MDTMKKVYLEKRNDEDMSFKTEMGCYSINMNDTDFQSVNSVMEEDLGLDDLDTLIQLELDNYTSCFSDIIDIQGEGVGETDLMQRDIYDASPAHSVTYEYLIPEPLNPSSGDSSDSRMQPITTSGESNQYNTWEKLSLRLLYSYCGKQQLHRTQQDENKALSLRRMASKFPSYQDPFKKNII